MHRILKRLLGIGGRLVALCLAMSLVAAAPPSEASSSSSPVAVGTRWVPDDADFSRPVYRTGFDDPAELSHWKLEGGDRAEIAGGQLVLTSHPAVSGQPRSINHLVLWLVREMPADFLLEFSVRPSSRADGLNIVFFNARGRRGESIFDPALAPRDGLFAQYHSGDLDNYHCSYWAGDRTSANLRKNHGFNLVASGPDRIAEGPADAFQTVRIYKRKGAIRLLVDDRIVIAWVDDGQTYGPVLTHTGWIGLRQMGHTRRCEYDHFAVYPLRP